MKTYSVKVLGTVLITLLLIVGLSYHFQSRENKQFKKEEIERKVLIDEKKKEILLFETQQRDNFKSIKEIRLDEINDTYGTHIFSI